MSNTRKATTLGLVIAFVTWLAGCTTFGPSAPPPNHAEYLVQPGDTLGIKFYYHPDHDQEVVVRSDGKLLLAPIGEVQAAGLTPTRLAEDLAQRYTNLRDPKIAISVKAMNQSRVYVGGEVNKPGFVLYRPGLTAVQAMLEAGGPKDTAKIAEVVLLQNRGERDYRASKLDLAKVLKEGDTSSDVSLAPSDVLFVPKTTIAKLNQYVDQYVIKLIPIKPGFAF